MSPELRVLVEHHLRRIGTIIDEHHDVIERAKTHDPSLIDREAIGMMLHSFYMGVEFILRAIKEDRMGRIAKDENWHRALLEWAAAPSRAGSAVISTQTRDALREYLEFRHRLRNIYGSDLQWPRMAPLASNAETVFAEFRTAIEACL